MVLLDAPEFLSALSKLFESTRSKGSLYLTIKRVKGRVKKGQPQPEGSHSLIRARANKARISTAIKDEEAEAFQAQLAVVLGDNMTGLIKEGKEKEKKKAKGGGGGSEDKMEIDTPVAAGEEPQQQKGGGAGGGASADKKKKKKKKR